MITDSFDISTEPLMSPKDLIGEQQHICDICLCTFSHVIFHEVIKNYPCEKISEIRAANGTKSIYAFTLGDRKIAINLMGIGSTLASNDVIELNWLVGATKFIMFGSAGNLNRAATEGKYVLPTEAYRDEGMSYHYAPPADYIKVRNAEVLSAIFDELGVPYVAGRIWTTDAFYRETRGEVARRQKDGCLAVEMEVAGVQAVCDFHGFQLYDFLQTGDVLDAPAWEGSKLDGANHDLDKFLLALEIAKRI